MEKIRTFYSNGKLLLTGEYAVLDGSLSLAVPTVWGQSLSVRQHKAPGLRWTSRDEKGRIWFEGSFDIVSLELRLLGSQNATSPTSDVNEESNSKRHGSQHKSTDSAAISNTLSRILREAKNLNPDFLSDAKGYKVDTKLDFPRDWGLGSSSTLINNIAQWANVDAYQLLWKAFSGSGYDIACAQHNRPILYRLEKESRSNDGDNQQLSHTKRRVLRSQRKDATDDPSQIKSEFESSFGSRPVVEEVDFNPRFQNWLHFVHLNQKQNSREGIAKYRQQDFNKKVVVKRISQITRQTVSCQNLKEFESLLTQHETLIAKTLQMPTVKESLFPDFKGTLKSLGAWGGDFILATGNEDVKSYFKEKGFETILPYSEMVLSFES
ncbi:MAG: GHMP kinase [Pricia sp.]